MRIPAPVAPDTAQGIRAFTKTGLRLGGSRHEELSRFLAVGFLSENAAAVESRACRVLSSSSGRALLPPVVDDESPAAFVAEAHSRDRHSACPANYNHANQSPACRPRFSLPQFTSFPPLCFPLPFASFLPHSSSALITALPPSVTLALSLSPSPSPPSFLPPLTRARYAPRRAYYGLTVRECHGPDRFSRPRTVDAASGERRTGVVR